MRLPAALVNRTWQVACLPAHRALQRSLADPRAAQEAKLAELLRANADTAFGRAHGFGAIRDMRDFSRRVPVRNADAYRPWLERVSQGEPRVLTTERVRRLQPTGGSTAGCKWIPYTRSLQREFGNALGPWIVDLFRTMPALRNGPAYWSVTPLPNREVPRRGAIATGFEEDSDYLGGLIAPLLASALAVPQPVRRVPDLETFRRTTLVHLLRARELRLLSVWHPTFLTLLLEAMRARWDDLLVAVERGLRRGISGLDTPPDPRRAAELAALGPHDTMRLWPRLGLVSAWADGPAAGPADALRRLFPGAVLQPKGLLATEAFVSIPFRGRHVLAIRSHVFEFEDPAGAVHPAWRLEQGGRYTVLVTTGGGLYRYRLGDRIEVTGQLDRTPCIRFVGRQDRVSDRVGEKLDEAFVANAIRTALRQHRVEADFAMLAPDRIGPGMGYVLFVHATEPVPPALAPALERALRVNPQYAWAVDLGQLRPASICEVGPGAHGLYLERLRGTGARLGDIKPAALSPLEGWREVLAGARQPSAAPLPDAAPAATGA